MVYEERSPHLRVVEKLNFRERRVAGEEVELNGVHRGCGWKGAIEAAEYRLQNTGYRWQSREEPAFLSRTTRFGVRLQVWFLCLVALGRKL